MDDPLSVLGLQPGASPAEVEEAYRRLAKRWHPDRGGGPDTAARMAAINVAHDLLRAGARHARGAHAHASAPARGATGRRRPAGDWLADPVRRALGPELLAALDDREPVVIVTPASLWKSPRAVLAVTDRRLLWLLDDAISDRVHSLRFSRVQEVSRRLAWPRRRTAIVRVLQRNGRRVSFADLTPATALQIVRHVDAAVR
jgi:curved DNA-binding protein CbpA